MRVEKKKLRLIFSSRPFYFFFASFSSPGAQDKKIVDFFNHIFASFSHPTSIWKTNFTMAKFLTICILLSLLLPLINWALSLLFTRVQLPRTLLVFAEILLVVVTLLAITAALLDFHLIINRREYTPIIYAPPSSIWPLFSLPSNHPALFAKSIK